MLLIMSVPAGPEVSKEAVAVVAEALAHAGSAWGPTLLVELAGSGGSLEGAPVPGEGQAWPAARWGPLAPPDFLARVVAPSDFWERLAGYLEGTTVSVVIAPSTQDSGASWPFLARGGFAPMVLARSGMARKDVEREVRAVAAATGKVVEVYYLDRE